jgi:hypothetical protein
MVQHGSIRRAPLEAGRGGAAGRPPPCQTRSLRHRAGQALSVGGTLTIGRKNHDADTLSIPGRIHRVGRPSRPHLLRLLTTACVLPGGDFQIRSIRAALRRGAGRRRRIRASQMDVLTFKEERQVFPLRRHRTTRAGREGTTSKKPAGSMPREAFSRRRGDRVASLAETHAWVGRSNTVVLQAQEPDARLPQQRQPRPKWSVLPAIPHGKHVGGSTGHGLRRRSSPRAVMRHRADFGLQRKEKNWSKDDRMELVRHDGYAWGSPAYDNTAAPWVDRVVFRTLPEDAARAAELEAGGIDLDIDVSPQHIARLEGRVSRSPRSRGCPRTTSASTWRRRSSRTRGCARRSPTPSTARRSSSS